MHAILPAATQAWVDQQFLQMGFDPSAALLDTIDDREDPFYSVYINLRNRLITYVDLGTEPSLNTRAHPVGAWNFQVYTFSVKLVPFVVRHANCYFAGAKRTATGSRD